jgi:hypothetical protein
MTLHGSPRACASTREPLNLNPSRANVETLRFIGRRGIDLPQAVEADVVERRSPAQHGCAPVALATV